MLRVLLLSLVGLLITATGAVADTTGAIDAPTSITVIRGVATSLSTEDATAVRQAFRYAFDDYSKQFVGADGVASRSFGDTVRITVFPDRDVAGGLIFLMEDQRNSERRVFSSARSLLAGIAKNGPRMTRYREIEIRGWVAFLRDQHDVYCQCHLKGGK